jgi:hypothetical protein
MNALLSPRIPIVALDQALALHAGLSSLATIARIGARFADVVLREPPLADAARWHRHEIGGRPLRFARPLTFTPYAASQPCSARCAFCSENLRDDHAPGRAASTLRPGPRYFDDLRAALAALRGVPLSYSLSGLESTDDADWFVELLRTLREAPDGPAVEGSVLYTNGAGFAREPDRLLDALGEFGLGWIEWSRHHDDAAGNQRLMRFRDGLAIAQDAPFEGALRRVAQAHPVKLVCIVQRDGIATPADVARYLARARALGVAGVIFREFSALPDSYRANATRRHIDAQRVPIDDLLLACLDAAPLEPVALTGGYYFWNARLRAADGLEVVFEKSDYGAMHAHEDSGHVYKLVFHPNGHLCAGWQPDQHVLWRPDARG